MIKTKADLKYYLDEDRKAYGKKNDKSLKGRIINLFFPDKNYEYMRNLRYLEYYLNNRGATAFTINLLPTNQKGETACDNRYRTARRLCRGWVAYRSREDSCAA